MPDTEPPRRIRPEHASSADPLTAVSQVFAIDFQTFAAANASWRG